MTDDISKVVRYCMFGQYSIDPDPQGEWVGYDDYATLARQLAEANALLAAESEQLTTAYSDLDKAESQLAEATRRLGEVEAYRDATFDGNAVYAALDDRAKSRTSADNVADVLDALNRVARATGEGEGHD